MSVGSFWYTAALLFGLFRSGLFSLLAMLLSSEVTSRLALSLRISGFDGMLIVIALVVIAIAIRNLLPFLPGRRE